MSIGYYVNMRIVEVVYRVLDIFMGDMNRGKMNGVMDEFVKQRKFYIFYLLNE